MTSGNSRGCAGCGGPNESMYSHIVKAVDVLLLSVLTVIFIWSLFTPPADGWAKAWAWGSAIFAGAALAMTACTYAPMPPGNWRSTVLHACLFANCVFWGLNSDTAAETCLSTPIPWACRGAMRYVFYTVMVVSGFLQFLFWHLEFDPRGSSAGSGRLPCLGTRQSNNDGNGMGMGGGSGGGGYPNDGYQNDGFNNELGREYRRRSKRSRRRRLADLEAFGSSEDKDGPHGLARSQSAGYESLGRRGSRSSRRLSSDSLDQL